MTSAETDLSLPKQCFTPIQSRTMYIGSRTSYPNDAATFTETHPTLTFFQTMALCPSMDVVVFVLASHKNTLLLHRTVSWQRLASRLIVPAVTNEKTASATPATTTTMEATEFSSTNETELSVQQVCWSPDGRSLAVATSNQTMELYHVETIGDAEATPLSQVALLESSGINDLAPATTRVTAMAWAHVGRPHPSWKMTNAEQLQQLTWQYRSQHYLDRAARFLPPLHEGSSLPSPHSHPYEHSLYDNDDGETDEALEYQRLSPACRTPLSMLMVATSDGDVHLYLHGRYPIARLTCDTSISTTNNGNMSFDTKLCCTADLTYVLLPYVRTDSNSPAPLSRVACFSLPALRYHRYELQVASALYGAITWQVQILKRHLYETLACWKSSLKPLDLKLENLQTVLTKHGVKDDLSKVLLQYIRFGQPTDTTTTGKTPTNSALDQFFTSVQMNDQLVQRLEKSLHTALSNVEGTCRNGLVRPARALVYDALQLVGLWNHNNEEAADATLRLQESVQALFSSTEMLLSLLVQARVRLHEFVAWLRSVAAQIKHRTLAHDTHTQRRVSQAVIKNVTEYLSGSCDAFSQASGTATIAGMTERLLGMDITHLCSSVMVDTHTKRPFSPRGVHHGSDVKGDTIPELLHRTNQDMKIIFQEPRTFLSRSLSQQEWVISSSDECDAAMDVHTRIGSGNNGIAPEIPDDAIDGCFRPRLVDGSVVAERAHEGADLSCCRNWALVAKAASWRGTLDSLLLYAVPLGWTTNDASDDYDLSDDDGEYNAGSDPYTELRPSFYLVCRLAVPPTSRIRQIAFYGDDGRSSLSSGMDSGTGKEGRQAIGLLLQRQADVEELWLFPYDEVEFQIVDVADGAPTQEVLLSEPNAGTAWSVQALNDDELAGDNDDKAVLAKTRLLATNETGGSKLLLSGSRGVGAVCSPLQNHVSLNLFDLEEDEETDDEEM